MAHLLAVLTARSYEMFDSVPRASSRKRGASSRLHPDLNIDFSDLGSSTKDSYRTELPTYRIASRRQQTRTFNNKEPVQDDPFSECANEAYETVGSLSFLFDTEFTFCNAAERVKDKHIVKLNRLRDYYKSRIKELPHPYISAAAVVSGASRRITTGGKDDPLFVYQGSIDVKEKPTERAEYRRKRSIDIFNPPFNSTTNEINEHHFNEEFHCSTVKVSENVKKKTQLSCKDYISSEESTYDYSYRTYTVDQKRSSSKSNKSLQTMLTMENVSKLSEIFRTAGKGNNTYDLSDERSEPFRLTKPVSVAPARESYRSAEGCCTSLDIQSNGYDLSVAELTDGVRARVVNWLVKLDEYTGGCVVALQCAVRFLDEMSARGGGVLPGGALACGAACFWIAAKLQSSRAPGAACVARHSGGAFTAHHLLACERRVLAALAFPAAPLVPADEVERLARAWRLGAEWDCQEAVQGAHYLCCCALLHARLAAAAPGALAAAALALAVRLLAPSHPMRDHLTYLRSGPHGWDANLERELESVCRAVSAPACACREPFLLYSSSRRRAPALRIAAALSTTRATTTNTTLY